MFPQDRCVQYAAPLAEANVALNQQLLTELLDALSFTSDTPPERIINVVKDEVDDLTCRAAAALRQLDPGPRGRYWHERALQLLRPNTCFFPRDELQELLGELEACAGAAVDPALQAIHTVIREYADKHAAFERRLGWLLRPSTQEEIQRLDPKEDCDQIYHFLTYEFRFESKLFSVLYELHPAIAPHISTFFLGTKEFTERAVRRIADTGLLFANMTEWGLDSKRGRTCLQRINGIHGRYHIHNDAFRFILSGIMFIPAEWNELFGWRPWTDTERLGWFHTFARLGRAMNIQGITDDYDEMRAWYTAYSRRNAGFSPVKRELFDRIAVQALSVWPENVRHLLVTALIAGMDESYRSALGYPEPPDEVMIAMKAVFFSAGHLCAGLPRTPWIRTLQSNVVYPYGPRVDELGVPRRSPNMPSLGEAARQMALSGDAAPSDWPPLNDNQGYPERLPPIASPEQVQDGTLPLMAWEEVRRRVAAGQSLLVIAGFVLDVGPFLREHPGGDKILRRHLGQDATEVFGKVGHSKEARTFMLNYRVGRIDDAAAATHPGGALIEAPGPRDGRKDGEVVVQKIETVDDWMAAIEPTLQVVKDFASRRRFDQMSAEGREELTRELVWGVPAR